MRQLFDCIPPNSGWNSPVDKYHRISQQTNTKSMQHKRSTKPQQLVGHIHHKSRETMQPMLVSHSRANFGYVVCSRRCTKTFQSRTNMFLYLKMRLSSKLRNKYILFLTKSTDLVIESLLCQGSQAPMCLRTAWDFVPNRSTCRTNCRG